MEQQVVNKQMEENLQATSKGKKSIKHKDRTGNKILYINCIG